MWVGLVADSVTCRYLDNRANAMSDIMTHVYSKHLQTLLLACLYVHLWSAAHLPGHLIRKFESCSVASSVHHSQT